MERDEKMNGNGPSYQTGRPNQADGMGSGGEGAGQEANLARILDSTQQVAENAPRGGGSTLANNAVALPDRPWMDSQRGQPGKSPMEFVASILRYKWTLLLIFVLISAPMIFVVWTHVVPLYIAKAEVRIRPIIPRLVFQTDENGRIPFYGSFVNTQVSIMKSPTILQRVLDQQKVRDTQWYKNPVLSPRQQLSGYTTTSHGKTQGKSFSTAAGGHGNR